MATSTVEISIFEKHSRVTISLIILVLTIITVLLVEGVLRFTPYKKQLVSKQNILNIYNDDGDNGFDLRANVSSTLHNFIDAEYEVFSNSLGCFDNEFDPVQEQRPILLVGDSFTWGYAPFNDKYGVLLEKMLGKRVLKCGVTGYGTHQELNKANKLIQNTGISPSLIIVGYFIGNDFFDDVTYPIARVINGYQIDVVTDIDFQSGVKTVRTKEQIQKEYQARYSQWKLWLKQNSALYHALYALAKTTFGTTKYFQWRFEHRFDRSKDFIYTWFYEHPATWLEWVQKAWEGHLDNLKSFQKLAGQQHTKLLIVEIPEKIQVYPQLIKASERVQYDLSAPNRKLNDFFEREGILYLDLLPPFLSKADKTEKKQLDSWKDLYWSMDSHWNIQANHLAGQLIGQFIQERHLLSAMQ